MKFKTEEERKRHPQVGLIPDSAWNDFLNNDFLDKIYDFPDEIIELMSIQDEKILFEKIKQITTDAPVDKKEDIFVAVICAHKQINYAEFIKILDIDFVKEIQCLAVCGNTTFLDAALARQNNETKVISKAFGYAASYGQLKILEYLKTKLAPVVWHAIITSSGDTGFCHAAAHGHLDIIKYIAKELSTININLSWRIFLKAFESTVMAGRLEVLRWLMEELVTDVNVHLIAIQAYGYKAFNAALFKNHVAVMDYLEEKIPNFLNSWIHYTNVGPVLESAALQDKKHMLVYVHNKRPESLIRNLHQILRLAVIHSSFDVTRYLLSFTDAFSEEDLANAFLSAVKYSSFDIAQYSSSFTDAFSYAEQHVFEYGHIIAPYVNNCLDKLRAQKDAFMAENPNGVFDVTEAENAKYLFYILRNLIRRNSEALNVNDNILMLLDIPHLKSLVHTAVTSRGENELLRLALSIGNRSAIDLLMNIQAVRELAARNNYYQEEQQGNINLRQIGEDRESSMRALTTGERERLASVIKHYTPIINESGIETVMSDLKQTLITRYETNPASIEIYATNGTKLTVKLPLLKQDFNSLDFSFENKEKALKAYYAHPEHTALRYLSKPNLWMHERASYVCVNPDNHQERWSTFEEYKDLISLLYIAVIDINMPPINDFTVDSRLFAFIKELAFIGRAHNWDKTRVVLNQNDEENTEEYDDEEGDRPSCFSGVKRRLFQSVLGHPMFIILTKQTIIEEIRDFARNHFAKKITDSNRSKLYAIWKKASSYDLTPEEKALTPEESLSDEDTSFLKTIDIENPIETFNALMLIKYGSQIMAADLQRVLQDRLAIKEKDCHLLHLGWTHPEAFLKQPQETMAATRHGFFPAPDDSCPINFSECKHGK